MFFFEKKNQKTFAWLVAASFLVAWPAFGQEGLPNVVTPDSVDLGVPASDLRPLVAPVALYPDAVLSNILAASTFPAQVVEAQRFLTDPANAGLQGQALLDAGAHHGWDRSVVSLLAFPPVLQMMDRDLERTENLGRAFAAQPADVLAAVQSLRRQAEAQGTLATGPYAHVVDEDGSIAIYPSSPQDVALPAYDPGCAFDPASGCVGASYAVVWSDVVYLPDDYVFWGFVDWRGHCLRTHPGGKGTMLPKGVVWHPPHAMGGRATPGAAFHYAPPASAPYAQRYSRPVVLPSHAVRGVAAGVPSRGAPAPAPSRPVPAAAHPAAVVPAGVVGFHH